MSKVSIAENINSRHKNTEGHRYLCDTDLHRKVKVDLIYLSDGQRPNIT